jgi:hypothetical protein
MVDRQSIIERAINVENIVCVLITRHFFQQREGINFNFMHTVLYDPLATSGFKVNVFHKCYPHLTKVEIELLRRIFNIRNFFAHAGLYVTKIADPDAAGYVDPKNRDDFLDFETLAIEFNKKASAAETLLARLLEESGVQLQSQPHS